MRKTKVVPSVKRRRLLERGDARVTSVTLPKSLHRQLMETSLALRWTAAEIMRAALQEWLTGHKGEIGRASR